MPSSKSGARKRQLTARQQKVAAARAAERRAERRRKILLWVGAFVVVAAVIGGVTAAVISRGGGGGANASAGTGKLGPEGMALESGKPLASADSAASGQTVDGVKCDSSEQVAYHIHTHVAVYVNGTLRPIPYGIGTVKPNVQQTKSGPFASATQCYYWLHTHVQDGVIHVESPTNNQYTLGQFFDIWRQPLAGSQVGPAKGKVTAYVNGKAYHGDPRAIPLRSREDVQLDVGKNVSPQSVDWSKSQL